jgi:hypothetical protein
MTCDRAPRAAARKMPGSARICHPHKVHRCGMNDPTILQPVVATIAALIDERAPLDELDRAWAVLLRLWNAVDRSAPIRDR